MHYKDGIMEDKRRFRKSVFCGVFLMVISIMGYSIYIAFSDIYANVVEFMNNHDLLKNGEATGNM